MAGCSSVAQHINGMGHKTQLQNVQLIKSANLPRELEA